MDDCEIVAPTAVYLGKLVDWNYTDEKMMTCCWCVSSRIVVGNMIHSQKGEEEIIDRDSFHLLQ